MRVLKVIAEGLTTSFRYPHFKQGIHPSYPMPPPATIYGHLCSAVGKWLDPQGVQFAYHFTHQGGCWDKEHIIVLGQSRGRLPNKDPKVLQGVISPFERELLFMPRMILYLNRPEWASAFRSPRHTVVLGRSQDLFTYTQVQVIDLVQTKHAYLEHTLAPHKMALRTMRGVTMVMPRYLDYSQRRRPFFSRYLVLEERVHSTAFLRYEGQQEDPFWVDPTTDEDKGVHMGLLFHSFLGAEDESPLLA